MDRQGKPVTHFQERISALIEELSATNDVIGIPTPALAETLVRSGPNRAQYMKILGDSWKFQLVPFDARAAIEAAELIAEIKTNKEKWANWAKVKFDIQIVATANAEGVSVIYSDDQDIENYAKRFNIRVIRICDLPMPDAAESKPIQGGPPGEQIGMFDPPQAAYVPFPDPGASGTAVESTLPAVVVPSDPPKGTQAEIESTASSEDLAPVQASEDGSLPVERTKNATESARSEKPE